MAWFEGIDDLGPKSVNQIGSTNRLPLMRCQFPEVVRERKSSKPWKPLLEKCYLDQILWSRSGNRELMPLGSLAFLLFPTAGAKSLGVKPHHEHEHKL
jgi:hypothetical protein